MRRAAGLVGGLGRLRDQLAVENRRRLDGRRIRPRRGRSASQDLVGAEGAQTGERGLVRAFDPHRAREGDPDRLARHRIVRIDTVLAHRPSGEHAVARTARLGDRLVEQTARHGRSQEAVHRDAARGESEDRDVVRIASEPGDVPLHPLQGRDLVHVGVVALGLLRALAAERGEREEAEAPQAVVEAHQDDAILGELDSRRHRGGTTAAHESAPVNPDHHGELRPWRGVRRAPDVQEQAIL